MKLKLAFLSLVFASFSVSANSSFQTSTVEKIILHDWGYVLVFLSGPVQSSEPCTNTGAIVLEPDYFHFDAMYSALLSAYHAGTIIDGWVDGCNTRHNAPVLKRLDLMPK